MTKFPKIILLAVISLLVAGCPAASTQVLVEGPTNQKTADECSDVYVGPNGSDDASGESTDEPLATIGSAVERIVPGCSVKVLPGRYVQSVHISDFPELEAPITIEGITLDASDEVPDFDGEDRLSTGIEISESSNFTLKNMSFAGYTDQGVYVWESEDIILTGLRVTRNGRASVNPDSDGEGFGINVDTASNITITGNTATFNGPDDTRFAEGTAGTGINTYQMTDSVIEGNLVIGNIGGGILVEDSDTVRVLNNQIENTNADLSHDGWWDAGIWLDGGKNIVVRHNVIRETLGPAIQVSDEDDQSPTGFVVVDNTIESNYYGLFMWNLGDCPDPDKNIAVFNNNVISDSSKDDILCSADGYPDIE